MKRKVKRKTDHKLTKREHLAGLAMQSIINVKLANQLISYVRNIASGGGGFKTEAISAKIVSQEAVLMADTLLKELKNVKKK